jgi:hypothetical protein
MKDKPMRKLRSTLTAVLGLGVIALLPRVASASFVLDTGTPDGSTGSFVLSTSSSLAAEFSITTAEQVTSLAAYLTEGSGQPGDTFTFDIDSGSILGQTKNSLTALQSITGTYTADGWNVTNTNFSLAAGTYWLVLEVGSTANTRGLDVPGESSPANGTAPALAFAVPGTSGRFTSNGAPAIGVQIAASPVPLPASAWLLGSGLLAGFGSLARRRRG